MSDLSHGEIQELLGAYALDAVDEQERAIIEAHLGTCESCRTELDDHRRLAGTLRRHATRVSPLASADANGSPGTSADAPQARRLRRGGRPVAVAMVVVILGGLFALMQIRFTDLNARMGHFELLEQAQLASADPGAIVTSLRTPGNEPVLAVVSRAGGGDGYAIRSALPLLAEGHMYELWRTDGAGVVATAVLGRYPDVSKFALPAGVTGFLVTVEDNPVPSQPTLPAVAAGRTSP